MGEDEEINRFGGFDIWWILNLPHARYIRFKADAYGQIPHADYSCKRSASRLYPALPATCSDSVASVLLISNQAAKFL